ncbi:MAG TPA: hypothetical protein VLS49_03695 [Usitatibacter sp.]|nr:hypothetical protein [Usitatibacter sp.]
MSSSGLAHENATNTPAETRSGQKPKASSDNDASSASSTSGQSSGDQAASDTDKTRKTKKSKSGVSGTAFHGAPHAGFIKTNYSSDTGSSTSKATSKDIGDRCDKTKHATLPADCKMTGARQGNATNETQGASGGPSSAAPGAAGSSTAGAGGTPGGTSGSSAGASGSAAGSSGSAAGSSGSGAGGGPGK